MSDHAFTIYILRQSGGKEYVLCSRHELDDASEAESWALQDMAETLTSGAYPGGLLKAFVMPNESDNGMIEICGNGPNEDHRMAKWLEREEELNRERAEEQWNTFRSARPYE